ncbi:hypothetical protein B856_07030 [Acinetobacter baumannii AC30]|nr:hypothetical protein B856_07030 [Acinetobacter baumannii AC30]
MPEAAPLSKPSPEPLPEPLPVPPLLPLSMVSLSFTVFDVVVGAVLTELDEELPMRVNEFPEMFRTPVIGAVISTSSPLPLPIP